MIESVLTAMQSTPNFSKVRCSEVSHYCRHPTMLLTKGRDYNLLLLYHWLRDQCCTVRFFYVVLRDQCCTSRLSSAMLGKQLFLENSEFQHLEMSHYFPFFSASQGRGAMFNSLKPSQWDGLSTAKRIVQIGLVILEITASKQTNKQTTLFYILV